MLGEPAQSTTGFQFLNPTPCTHISLCIWLHRYYLAATTPFILWYKVCITTGRRFLYPGNTHRSAESPTANIGMGVTAKSRHSGLTGKGDQSRLFTKREGHRPLQKHYRRFSFDVTASHSKCASGMSCLGWCLESYCTLSSVLHSGWQTKYSVEMLTKVPAMQNQNIRLHIYNYF